ncbi:PAS domain-containing protein [uncultured Roseovarius sp.]|uniref:PAS domain-containing protein n=1 Tax=uncultured Roseovarius sp. TaxID=293344 RepID=UPI00261B9D21|nr:PAS domain-containing protein [uncultured Roseovarius sp.]
MQDEINYGKAALMHSGTRGKEKSLAAFVAYWSSMRKGHDVPRRTDIDPRGIEALLENAFIAEKIAPGLARLRIAGTHLSDLMGMEVRGMPISALIAPEQRDELAELLVEVFDRPAIVKINLVSPAGVGRRKLKGTLLLLPLRSDLGDTSRALGCFLTDGLIGRTPRRFNITGHSVEVAAGRKHEAVQKSEKEVPENGFAESGMPFQAVPPQHPSERPYLRLVPPGEEE